MGKEISKKWDIQKGSRLTGEDIRRAVDVLKENDRKEITLNTVLEDRSKMNDFYVALFNSDLSEEDRVSLAQTIEMLSIGHFLILGEKQYQITIDILRSYSVPEEVLGNIFTDKKAALIRGAASINSLADTHFE